MRLLPVSLVIAIAAICFTASATAAPPTHSTATLESTAALRDTNGHIRQTWHKTGPVDQKMTVGEKIPKPYAAFPGCMDVNNKIKEHAYDPIFGYTYWVYHEDLHWCWGFGGITSFDTTVYFSDVGTGWVNDDPRHGFLAYYYTWQGNVKGGRYVYRQGKIEECAAILCAWTIGAMYPYIKLWVNAGPWYTWTGDTNS